MTQEQFTTQVIKPAEGKFLTQAGDVDIRQRVVATAVALGANSSASDWKEISAKQAEAYNAEKLAAAKEDHARRKAEHEAKMQQRLAEQQKEQPTE